MAKIHGTGHFWLFGGDIYYAAGGIHDFLGAYTSKQEAIDAGHQFIADNDYKVLLWWHVADMLTGTIVAGTQRQALGAEDLRPEISMPSDEQSGEAAVARVPDEPDKAKE